MKLLFANRIYNSLCSIVISYGVITLINGAMAKTGYWLTTTQNLAMELAVFAAVSTVMYGIQHALFSGLKLPAEKMFSKASLVEAAAVVFVLLSASMFADVVSYYFVLSKVGIVHVALMGVGVIFIARIVSAYVSQKGFIHEHALARA
ncbi:hypothetical protein [Pseudomonas sp. NPDC089569]|uniref:hypothetical protein n=1 Tax=Pseudomonas sp. NPDC089569 TaxID=3390722 RepID=UPI003CFE1AD1